MAPSDFAHYPEPIQGPTVDYVPPPARNPVLRGLSLLAVGEIVSRSSLLQQYLWNNGGFGAIKEMAVLDNMPYTFHPLVTPLGKTGPMLDSDPAEFGSASSSSSSSSSSTTSSATRYYTAADYHALYKSRKVTPLQVTSALLSLSRRRRPDDGPASRYADAWAECHGKEHLALEAARASTERYAAGEPRGLLDGVPVGVKDDVDVEGYVCHFGLKYDAARPCFKEREASAWPVKMLQEAGAVVIGKFRMHELGSDTNGLNVAQGTPTNHLNNAYYPGGSSSGPGSAISAGLIPICVATDAGGSVRIPANFNGIYGLKTTHHRTMAMNSTMCVTGPMAATVADLRLAYRVMSQPNADCPIQGRFALSIPPEPSSSPRVMGVYRDWWRPADPRVASACEEAIEWFAAERGYRIVDITIPYLAEAQTAHGSACIGEMSVSARRRTLNPVDWITMTSPANKLLMSVGSQASAADYLSANALRTLLMRHLAFLFQKYPGLLIMTPTTPIIGWPKMAGDEAYGVSDTNLTLRNMMYVFLANLTGTPSLSAPVAYVDPDQGQGSLAVSLLATGEWGAEEQLLSWAKETEEYLHRRPGSTGRRRPDSWVDVVDLASRESAP
ncbi:hypothetical protein CP532_0181 [Ophiocordyceps camponoti-leonardi (nom. inval.)]|nr:hypothetical protein CP532_0181 [Ophiocordyceps camponoti-leonardi (nom. inval.)]